MPRRQPRPITIAIAAALCSLLIHTGTPGQAGPVQLNWQEPTADAESPTLRDFAGYRVYYGLSSGSYDLALDIGNALSIAISGLVDGITYYVAVTAYDRSGNESPFSNEVSITPSAAPPPPP
jgi:hypothetical protein